MPWLLSPSSFTLDSFWKNILKSTQQCGIDVHLSFRPCFSLPTFSVLEKGSHSPPEFLVYDKFCFNYLPRHFYFHHFLAVLRHIQNSVHLWYPEGLRWAANVRVWFSSEQMTDTVLEMSGENYIHHVCALSMSLRGTIPMREPNGASCCFHRSLNI